MNPIKAITKHTDFISKAFASKLAHIGPYSMAMYFAKYGLYSAEKDKALENKYKLYNEKFVADLQEIQNFQKFFSLKTWKEEKAENSSHLYREFVFNNNAQALQFVDKMRPKCNELDHHPEWQIINNVIKVKLTSHFNNNNVSAKDYELAAYFALSYDDSCGLASYQPYLSYLLGAGIISGIAFIALYLYNFKRNYRFTSMDFMFARIDTPDNAYIKKGFTKY